MGIVKCAQIRRTKRIAVGNQKGVTSYELRGVLDSACGSERLVLVGNDELQRTAPAAIVITDDLRHVSGAQNETPEAEFAERIYKDIEKGPVVYLGHRLGAIVDDPAQATSGAATQYDRVNVTEPVLNRSPGVHIR